MRANISLNIDLERVPQLVRGLLLSEGARLAGLVQRFNDDVTTPLDELEFDKLVLNLQSLRETLEDINVVVAQAENITVGYMEKDNIQEAPDAMAESIKNRAQQGQDMQEKYVAFLDRINSTDNVHHEDHAVSEDTEEEEEP